MLEQVPAATQAVGKGIELLDIGVIGLLLKAAVDITRELIRSRQEKSKVRFAQAEARLEEAKTYGIEIMKGKNGIPDKAGLIAFCPAHIDYERRLATQENETKHINEDLGEIKADVKFIRAAVGK
jgi:hypothetical protein